MIYDISMILRKNTLVYPGDPAFQIWKIQTLEKNSWNLSKICMSLHTGSHLDAPLHTINFGKGILDLDLENCIGKCKVIDLSDIEFGKMILRVHLKKFSINKEEIILFKTKNSNLGNNKYHNNYIRLSIDAAQFLVEKGVKAVGIDYLGIGNEEVHNVLAKNGVLIYEYLNLRDITKGEYFFIGLPLKIDSEASPVRAILIDEMELKNLFKF
ncbi:MAG: cyclase family protein [Candidatus Helarchaeota archaeon]